MTKALAMRDLLGHLLVLRRANGSDSLTSWRIQGIVDTKVRLKNVHTGVLTVESRSDVLNWIDSGVVRLE